MRTIVPYSQGDKDAALAIYLRFGYCNNETLDEIERVIGKRPTPQIVRAWKRKAMQPKKRSHHRKVVAPEGTSNADSAGGAELTKTEPAFLETGESLSPGDRVQKLYAIIDRLIDDWTEGQPVDPKVLLTAIEKLDASTSTGDGLTAAQAVIWHRWTVVCEQYAASDPTGISQVDPWRELERTTMFAEDQIKIAAMSAKLGREVSWNEMPQDGRGHLL